MAEMRKQKKGVCQIGRASNFGEPFESGTGENVKIVEDLNDGGRRLIPDKFFAFKFCQFFEASIMAMKYKYV